MFSFFRYACSPFRDDTSSALLHPEREEMQREREREIKKQADGEQRDTASVRTWKNDDE
jgi:hypothetical protein